MTRLAILAAGGTGGHLLPATALAETLRERGWLPHFVTDRRALPHFRADVELPLTILPAAGLADRSVWERAKAIPVLGLGALQALLLQRRKRPAVVIGFGGYASLPAGVAAWLGRVPLIVHEANAVLGRANRFLASRANALAATFPNPAGLPAGVRASRVGLPIRAEFEDLASVAYVPPSADSAIRIVVTGGSQGARALGIMVPEALAGLPGSVRQRLEVLQQARPEMMDDVEDTYRVAGIRATVVPFIDELATALRDAHLIVCRAGAATVAENSVAGRPAVYIPLPTSIDGHQDANAGAATAVEAAWVVAEKRGPKALGELVGTLLTAPERLAAAADNARRVVPAGAAGRLADLIEDATQGSAL